MNTRYQQPELRGQLSAEYALGTLRGRARARFERLLRGDIPLREEVSFWQERFSEFALRLKPIAPREVVWTALERTIAVDARKTVPLSARPSNHGRPSRTLVWQTWAAAATLAAVALGVGLQLEREKSLALSKALQLEQGRATELYAALNTERSKPMPYVAVIQPEGGDARWAISLHPDKNMMRIVLSGSQMPADVTLRSLQLWMLDSKGRPHSLGLLPVSGSKPMEMPMPRMPAKEMGATLTLAVSEEPRGGSPTGLPTGKVLGAVPAVKPI